MNQDNWWEVGSQDRTDQTLEQYSQDVQEYLETEGIKGYLLGDPTICGYTTMQVCVLDPQEDIYNNVLLFATQITKFNDPEFKLQPLKKDSYNYIYDNFHKDYQLELRSEGVDNKIQSFQGRFDRKAKITEMREI